MHDELAKHMDAIQVDVLCRFGNLSQNPVRSAIDGFEHYTAVPDHEANQGHVKVNCSCPRGKVS